MGWESLRGQDAAVAALRRDLASGRVAHAYVLHGPPGVGKATAARLFAQALECEGDDPPCGACGPCLKAERGVHPDIITAAPGTDSSGRRRSSIGVEDIRDQILARAYQRPQEGRWKVFLLGDDPPPTVQAFNALLKTLEEPPGRTVLIVIAPSLHALPVTVVSRCRRVRFQALGREDQRAILAGALEAEPEAADRLVSLSLGRLGVALREDMEVLEERREAAIRLLEGLAEPPGKADVIGLLDIAASRAGRGGRTRDEVLAFLEMIRGLLRDILVLEAAPGSLEPWHADLADRLADLGRRWGVGGLVEALEIVGSARQDVGVVNSNPALTLEALVIALRGTVPAGA